MVYYRATCTCVSDSSKITRDQNNSCILQGYLHVCEWSQQNCRDPINRLPANYHLLWEARCHLQGVDNHYWNMAPNLPAKVNIVWCVCVCVCLCVCVCHLSLVTHRIVGYITDCWLINGLLVTQLTFAGSVGFPLRLWVAWIASRSEPISWKTTGRAVLRYEIEWVWLCLLICAKITGLSNSSMKYYLGLHTNALPSAVVPLGISNAMWYVHFVLQSTCGPHTQVLTNVGVLTEGNSMTHPYRACSWFSYT